MSLDSSILIDSHADIGKTSLPLSNAMWQGHPSTRPWGTLLALFDAQGVSPGVAAIKVRKLH
jgi:hypothetical protein